MDNSLIQLLLETVQKPGSLEGIVLNLTSSLIYDSAKQFGSTLWGKAKGFWSNEKEAEEFLKKISITEKKVDEDIEEQIKKIFCEISTCKDILFKQDEFLIVFKDWLKQCNFEVTPKVSVFDSSTITQRAGRDIYNVAGPLIIKRGKDNE